MKLLLGAIMLSFLNANAFAIPGHLKCEIDDTRECCAQTPINWCLEDQNMVFKILRVGEWDDLRLNGVFYGSAHDQRDGFIHLATGEQLSYVIDKYFANIPVYIAGYDPKNLGEDLLWEDGFPHLYNSPLVIEDTIEPGFYIKK